MDAIGKTRDQYVQALKGLCIIFVVLIHLPWGEAGQWTAWLWIAVRKTVNFAVAVFFFLSAYYTPSYEHIVAEGIGHYYRRRLKRLLIPYAVWSVVYVFVLPFVTTGAISKSWSYELLTGVGPTYFLLALSQFTLLNPILQRFRQRGWFLMAAVAVTMIYLVAYYCYNFSTGRELKPELVYFFPWTICYCLGLVMRSRQGNSSVSAMSALALVVALLMLSVAESMFIYAGTGIFSFAISQITVGSVAYSVGMILLFMALWQGNQAGVSKILSSLGDYAMGIFLMHPLFIWIFKYIALHTPGGMIFYHTDFGYMSINMVVLVMSVVSSYLAAVVLSRKFPHLVVPLGLK